MIAIPSKINAEEKLPKIKYFKPASVDKEEVCFEAASTYSDKPFSSNTKKKPNKSFVLSSKILLKNEKNIKNTNSKS